MKKYLLLLSLLCFLSGSEYQDWLKTQEKEYLTYKKSFDQDFVEALKKDWLHFQSSHSLNPYEKNKPQILNSINNPFDLSKKEIKRSKIITIKNINKEKDTKIVLKEKTILTLNNLKKISFSFYSQEINIYYDKKHKKILMNNKDAFSAFWNDISKSEYQGTLQQFEDYARELNLNDWAKYLLIYKSAYHIYQDKNMANLFTWFYLSKMNYDVKIAFNENNIYLISKLTHKLYEVSYVRIKDKRYYVLSAEKPIKNIGQVYTYKSTYQNANKSLSFTSNKAIKLFGNIKEKVLNFSYENKQYKIKAKYSLDLIDFYSTFPQSDYKVYFNSTHSLLLSSSLLKELKIIIEGKTEIEAINILLRFVQTAFAYKSDKENFFKENVLFPEETIFYSYSDCEDRSILFNFLVKNLSNLDIIALKYNNHLSNAIAFSSYVKGDSTQYKNKRYVVSDPTYINANIGQTMPSYKNKKFKIIEIN
ncbi:MAG: hypothetical protein COA66_15735 [Arcobacter sp.]|nr:MAG: hypothetical protein COA66_15735 [Arcobacter sp.]